MLFLKPPVPQNRDNPFGKINLRGNRKWRVFFSDTSSIANAQLFANKTFFFLNTPLYLTKIPKLQLLNLYAKVLLFAYSQIYS